MGEDMADFTQCLNGSQDKKEVADHIRDPIGGRTHHFLDEWAGQPIKECQPCQNKNRCSDDLANAHGFAILDQAHLEAGNKTFCR